MYFQTLEVVVSFISMTIFLYNRQFVCQTFGRRKKGTRFTEMVRLEEKCSRKSAQKIVFR